MMEDVEAVSSPSLPLAPTRSDRSNDDCLGRSRWTRACPLAPEKGSERHNRAVSAPLPGRGEASNKAEDVEFFCILVCLRNS